MCDQSKKAAVVIETVTDIVIESARANPNGLIVAIVGIVVIVLRVVIVVLVSIVVVVNVIVIIVMVAFVDAVVVALLSYVR